jgi:HEAT repeat protein
VRQAALEAIGDRSGAPAAAAAQARVRPLLLGDRWTFVRTAAAAALGAGRTEEAGDEALVGALEDQSPLVRAAALRALGSRGSQRAADRVHAVADDPREQLEVRVVAVGTLGQLCRRDAVDLLTKLALRAGLAQLPYDRPLGTAALAALGAIHPDDLATRLAPLLARDRRIPAHVRLIARDVTERPGSCR